MNPNVVNHSQVGNVFMLGAAGPIVVALAAYFGRYPILFWWTLFALATAIWCAAAQSFESFMVCSVILNSSKISNITLPGRPDPQRIFLNSCSRRKHLHSSSTTPFVNPNHRQGGLMFIKDMFFLHEHARKINIWSGFIILSPYMGPLFGSFIVNTQIWQWAFGVYAIETGLCLIAIILFVDETYYDRKTVQPELVPNGPRWQRMLGIQQVRTKYIKNSFKDACMRPVTMLRKPVIILIVIAYMLMFAWVVGINTTLSIFLAPKYGFGAKAIGMFPSQNWMSTWTISDYTNDDKVSFTSPP